MAVLLTYLELVLTVSPKTEYFGSLDPTTLARTGPL